jgi:hypothetical protein
VLAKLDQGQLVSLLGRPKKMSVYLIGNPVLANRMYDQHPAVGFYAPLRASIYEDYEGRSHFSYDRPSGLLEQFDNEEIRAVARILDQKGKFWLTGWPVEDHSVGWFCVLQPRLGHVWPPSCDKSGLNRQESRMPCSV